MRYCSLVWNNGLLARFSAPFRVSGWAWMQRVRQRYWSVESCNAAQNKITYKLQRLTFTFNWTTSAYRCSAEHTHPFNGPFPGLPRWAGTRKVKPIWILLKQETVSGSGISWAVCKSASRSRQITTPAPHHSVFYRLDALPATQPTASKHCRQSRSVRSNSKSQSWRRKKQKGCSGKDLQKRKVLILVWKREWVINTCRLNASLDWYSVEATAVSTHSGLSGIRYDNITFRNSIICCNKPHTNNNRFYGLFSTTIWVSWSSISNEQFQWGLKPTFSSREKLAFKNVLNWTEVQQQR